METRAHPAGAVARGARLALLVGGVGGPGGPDGDGVLVDGENVFPREVEELIETHPSVLFAAVIGMPDELYQEVGWAYIMTMPEQTVGEEELRELCKSKIANFKVPKRFFVRPLLPLLASGKVSKMELKKEAADLIEKDAG